MATAACLRMPRSSRRSGKCHDSVREHDDGEAVATAIAPMTADPCRTWQAPSRRPSRIAIIQAGAEQRDDLAGRDVHGRPGMPEIAA